MTTNTALPPDWWAEFVKDNPVPPESIEHFRSVDWTKKYIDDSAYEPIPAFSRTTKPNGEDRFFSQTINTTQTLPHMVCLQLKGFKTPDISSTPDDQSNTAGRKRAAVPPERPEILFLIKVGGDGLDGHPAVLHGGVCCAILDEMMGSLVMLHCHNIDGPFRRNFMYTLSLNTTYYAPAPTPGELVVRTWLVKRETRKWTAIGQIVDKNGTVCTEAVGLWIMVPNQKL